VLSFSLWRRAPRGPVTATMENTPKNPSDSACSGCSCKCSVEPDPPADAPAGWRLIGGAAIAFLLPLALGVVGAAGLAGVVWQQVLGCIGGITAGIAIAVLVARATARKEGAL